MDGVEYVVHTSAVCSGQKIVFLPDSVSILHWMDASCLFLALLLPSKYCTAKPAHLEHIKDSPDEGLD